MSSRLVMTFFVLCAWVFSHALRRPRGACVNSHSRLFSDAWTRENGRTQRKPRLHAGTLQHISIGTRRIQRKPRPRAGTPDAHPAVFGGLGGFRSCGLRRAVRRTSLCGSRCALRYLLYLSFTVSSLLHYQDPAGRRAVCVLCVARVAFGLRILCCGGVVPRTDAYCRHCV